MCGEVAMSDRGNDPAGGSNGGAELFDVFDDAGRDDIPVDAIDELEPASDLDDVAFGLDVNPDDVDMTFDPDWQPSVADRPWGDGPGAGPGSWGGSGSWGASGSSGGSGSWGERTWGADD